MTCAFIMGLFAHQHTCHTASKSHREASAKGTNTPSSRTQFKLVHREHPYHLLIYGVPLWHTHNSTGHKYNKETQKNVELWNTFAYFTGRKKTCLCCYFYYHDANTKTRALDHNVKSVGLANIFLDFF